MLSIRDSIEKLPRVQARFLPRIKKLGIETVQDLLYHFPVRYEDFSQVYPIADLIPSQEATVQGVIEEVKSRRSWQKHITIVEAVISDETASIRAVWFNQPYISSILVPGRMASFSGKVTEKDGVLSLSNPTYEIVGSRGETNHTARIVGIYPETRGFTSKGIRSIVKTAFLAIGSLKEFVPDETLAKENLPLITSAFHAIHFPESIDEALRAGRRFAFQDLFLLQLSVLEQKLKLAETKAPAIGIEVEKVKEIIAGLPYQLTISQKRSLWEVIKDLNRGRPMNRLLQGDVGSGKTIVAALAAVLVGENGYQTAFMAPTEILARQHYKTLRKFFPDHDYGIALLTASEARISYGGGLETASKKAEIVREITSGKAAIVIGTHALIQKNIVFPRIAFVVIDEQHRFGVRQRALLLRGETRAGRGLAPKNLSVPHFLSMSATPIPRTLSLTLFGDLDLSLIDELPKDRKNIITKAVAPGKRDSAYKFIRGEVKKGRQVFVVCPRINPAESVEAVSFRPAKDARFFALLEAKSVKEEYEKLAQKVFPDLRVAMLHGKMKAREKEEIMGRFGAGETDILVATSVVEVGIDVPNATIMMIEGAERFGLAQLYQFRGRVGRSKHQSFCFLFTESDSKNTFVRLKSITEAKNGLELAEKDLKIRGPGEFLGEIQTGMPDIAMKALQNPDLVKTAREAAKEVLTKDRGLKRHSALREQLESFQDQVHWE